MQSIQDSLFSMDIVVIIVIHIHIILICIPANLDRLGGFKVRTNSVISFDLVEDTLHRRSNLR